eukprot:3789297-Rhodomonas_salina.3
MHDVRIAHGAAAAERDRTRHLPDSQFRSTLSPSTSPLVAPCSTSVPGFASCEQGSGAVEEEGSCTSSMLAVSAAPLDPAVLRDPWRLRRCLSGSTGQHISSGRNLFASNQSRCWYRAWHRTRAVRFQQAPAILLAAFTTFHSELRSSPLISTWQRRYLSAVHGISDRRKGPTSHFCRSASTHSSPFMIPCSRKSWQDNSLLAPGSACRTVPHAHTSSGTAVRNISPVTSPYRAEDACQLATCEYLRSYQEPEPCLSLC